MDLVISFFKLFVLINFFLLTLSCVILPPLYPKKIFFITLLALFLLDLFKNRYLKLYIINPFLIIFFLGFYFFYGALNESDLSLGLQFFSSTVLLVIFYVIVRFGICVNKNLKYSVFILVFVIYYLSAGYFGIVSGLPFGDELVDIFIKYELGFIGQRDFGIIVLPMLHFITSPLLLILSSLLIIENSGKLSIKLFFFLVTIFGATYFSGSRGIFLFSILSAFVLFLYFSSRMKKMVVSSLIGALIIFVALTYDFGMIANSKETSNSVKLAHAYSYLDSVDSKSLILGDGLASTYFTQGFGRVTAQTELMLFDFLRYFGVFNTIFFYIFLVFPIVIRRGAIKLINPFKSHATPYAICFSFYLLLAMSNPMVLNSYGMIVVIWYWANVYRFLVAPDYAANNGAPANL